MGLDLNTSQAISNLTAANSAADTQQFIGIKRIVSALLPWLNNLGTDRIATVALTGGVDTGGGLGSWVNPESSNIIIDTVQLNVTTVATAALSVDIGTTATNATTASDNLIDGADGHTATGVFDNNTDKGANGKTRQLLAPGKWVTASMADATASAGFVGTMYIRYHTV